MAALTAIAVLTDIPAIRAVAAAGAAATAVGVPTHHLLLILKDQAQEARDLWGLAGVMVDGRSWPPPGDWALGADALAFLESEIASRGLRNIIELGPGTSSVVLGRRFGGSVEIFGLEHDEGFLARVQDQLDQHGLATYNLIHAPLDADRWYCRDALESLPASIDLLVVDGPPNWRGRGNRCPAWNELADRLRPGAVILVDDTNRPDERLMALTWMQDRRLRLLRDAGSFIALEVVA